MNTEPLSKAKSGRPRQRGTALIVVIILLSIIVMFALSNVRTLDHLGRELRLLEVQQLRNLPAAIPRLPTNNSKQPG